MISPNEYAARANALAPKTIHEMREAARQLAAAGHGDYEIAAALRINVEQIRRMLGRCGDCG